MSKPVCAVFIGSEESVFVSRTQDTLIQRGISVIVIDPYKTGDAATGNTLIHKVGRMFDRYRKVKRQIRSIPKEHTAIVHFLSVDCFWLIPLLAQHFDRVVGLAYGSDILRRVKSRDFLLRFGLKRLGTVAATNDNVLSSMLKDFPFLESRTPRIIRFGLSSFDVLRKTDYISPTQAKINLGFEPNKLLISLGYSASPGQRQIELIDFFSSHHAQFKNAIFVIPVQYGVKDTVAAVVDKCAEINNRNGGNQFIPLTEFHGVDKLCLMRRATDVLINNSISDAFSATVQEVVYAGNLVLAAEHLPYSNMPGFGYSIRTYRNLGETLSQLSLDAVKSWRSEAAKQSVETRAELHATSSWDAVFSDWERLISTDSK